MVAIPTRHPPSAYHCRGHPARHGASEAACALATPGSAVAPWDNRGCAAFSFLSVTTIGVVVHLQRNPAHLEGGSVECVLHASRGRALDAPSVKRLEDLCRVQPLLSPRAPPWVFGMCLLSLAFTRSLTSPQLPVQAIEPQAALPLPPGIRRGNSYAYVENLPCRILSNPREQFGLTA